jgi:hypothetical protein
LAGTLKLAGFPFFCKISSDDDKKAAMKEAINWCIGNGILKPFLETQGSENE